MLNKLMKYKWVLTAWMMLLGGLLCPNLAYSQTIRSTSGVYASTIDRQSFNQAAYTQPAYHFQSTSAYTTVVGSSVYSSTISSPFAAYSPMSAPRKAKAYNPWDEDDDPTGEELGVVNTPIGEPLILLLFALLYIARLTYRKKRHLHAS